MGAADAATAYRVHHPTQNVTAHAGTDLHAAVAELARVAAQAALHGEACAGWQLQMHPPGGDWQCIGFTLPAVVLGGMPTVLGDATMDDE